MFCIWFAFINCLQINPWMSSVNRVLKKRREAHSRDETQETPSSSSQHISTGEAHSQPQSNPTYQQQATYSPEKEQQFEEYAQYMQYNPSSFEFSNSYIPASLALYNRYRAPLSCFINPINPDLEYTEQSASSIPRCSSCRAYMNYYNQASKKGYKCFLCGRENHYDFEYSPENNGVQLQSPSYLVDGPQGVYQAAPPELTYIFLVDVSRDAFQCQMLSYMVSVIRDVLAREDLDDALIYFYTFDDTVHEYDFTGEEAERTVVDFSLKPQSRSPDNFLGQVREKLFALLDSLEDVAERNQKQGSRFFQIFEYVYESVKHTGGKMFVFQASEAMAGQNFTNEAFKWSSNPQDQNVKLKSMLQTRNKLFFNRFVQPMLNDNMSASFFIFARGRKNIRVLSDTCKLTNSELLLYGKDSPEELTKFYYDFYHLLSATYYIDTRVEFIISAGWYYTAVYGNLYRLKEYITFKFCHFQDSKRVCAVFLPQDGFLPLPYFSIQIVTNYIYQRKHYLSVNTGVVPFTSSIDRLFENMHVQATASTFFKIYMSSLRLEDIVSVKNKYLKHAATIWKALLDYYRGNYPPEVRALVLSLLGFLKNYHSQIDIINNTPQLEKVVSQRNLLQSCNYSDCHNVFSPYLFDLTSIDSSRCQPDNFVYPDACELRFSSVKEGLFLMDAGTVLYLFVARQCHSHYLQALFGKEKLLKTDQVSEETVAGVGSEFSGQVMELVRVLREGKTYQWVPMHVVRCGENSEHEKNFYLHFYEEKYDEFKTYKLSFEEFVAMLNKHH